MSLKVLSEEAKATAVGEVLAGFGTLSSVARRHGISIGYLSILVSRARNAVESKTKQSATCKKDSMGISSLEVRVHKLEQKINRIFK